MLLLFFFKQKTAYEMRISDWSSDVCSSDLLRVILVDQQVPGVPGVIAHTRGDHHDRVDLRPILSDDLHRLVAQRGQVVQGVERQGNQRQWRDGKTDHDTVGSGESGHIKCSL